MPKTEVVPNSAPTNDPYKADDGAFGEVAAIWDAKFQEAKTADIADEQAAEAAAPEQEVVTEAAPEAAPPPAPVAPPEEAAPTVAALLAKAREEAEARSRFKEERSFEQEIAKAKAEAAALEAQILQDPLSFLKAKGINPIDFANQAYAEALGDDAPAEFKTKLNQTAVERRVEEKLRELEKREQQWQQAQQQREVQAMITQLDNELVATVQNAPDSYRVFKRVASRNQNRAYDALVEATNQYYQASGGILPTAQVALQMAEAGLAELERDFLADLETKSDAVTQATEGKEDRKKSAAKSLSDTETAERPSRRSSGEPDARDTNAWIRAGLRAIERKA